MAIAKDYTRWSVIEVNLSATFDRARNLLQLRVLKDGDYGRYHRKHIKEACEEIDSSSLRDMVEYEPPSVVLLGTRDIRAFETEITAIGCRVAIADLYKSDAGAYALLLNGDLLEYPEEFSIILQPMAFSGRLLRTAQSARLPISQGERLQVTFDGRPIEVERLDAGRGSDAVLCTIGSVSLVADARYRFTKAGQAYWLERIDII